MLPKNYSLRKILVVFSFFEIFCTRVGNSERFSQGKLMLQFSTQMQNDEIRCVGCVVCCSSSSIVLPIKISPKNYLNNGNLESYSKVCLDIDIETFFQQLNFLKSTLTQSLFLLRLHWLSK